MSTQTMRRRGLSLWSTMNNGQEALSLIVFVFIYIPDSAISAFMLSPQSASVLLLYYAADA